MKKTSISGILFCSLFLLMGQITAKAQKHCDLALSIVSPVEGEEFPYGDTVKLIVSIKNLGPDLVDSSNKIYLLMKGDLPIPLVFHQKIAVGDSLVRLAFQTMSLQDTDYVMNACLFLQKNRDTSMIDPFQANDTACVSFILKAGSTGIKNLDHRPGLLKLYPNPASSRVMLSWDIEQPEPINVAIRDITGRYLLSKDYGKRSPGKQILPLDISALQPGIYFVELKQGAERRIGKLMVQ